MGLNLSIALLIIGLTVFVAFYYYKRIHGAIPRLALLFSLLSIFIYSGLGISLPEVPNKFIVHFILSIICFCYPFYRLFGKSIDYDESCEWFDVFLEKRIHLIRFLFFTYLIFDIIPCVFPRFKLFDVLIYGISIIDIYDQYNATMDNSFLRLIDSLGTLICPFFYAYLAYLRINKPKSIIPILFLIINIYLGIARYSYVGRYKIAVDFLMLFMFIFCVRKEGFRITKKQIIVLLSVAVASIPFMYAYLFIRSGVGYDEISFSQSLTLLMESEVDYPKYYEHIVTSHVLEEESSISFLLWLICLPIPSVLWPGKPTLYNDVFTFSITGLHRADYGYSSLLPSYLGESLIYFGPYFFWLYALLIGFVFAYILKFILKNKYLVFFAVTLSLRLLTIGRAGATAALPSFINSSLILFILYLFTKNSAKTCK